MALKLCKECGNQVSTTAKSCPKCGAPIKAPSGWFTKIIKGIGYLVVVLFVAGFIAGLAGRKSTLASSSIPLAAPDEPSEAINVQASQLAAAYERNGVSADAKFKGNRLRVTGSVTAIGTDMFNHATVSLDGKVNPFLQPQAVLDESERSRAGSLNVGQAVILVCTGAGDVIKMPMLRDCTFSR